MKRIKKIKLLLIGLLLILGCTSDDDAQVVIDNNAGTTGGSINQGSDIQRTFIGKVMDDSGNNVAGAQVAIGNSVVMTDSKGVFLIEDANVKTKQAYIKVVKSGFYEGFKTTVPTTGANSVTVTLIAKTPAVVVASGATSSVTLGNGAKVTFDGDFQDSNGNPYNGNVNVSMYYLDAGDADLQSKMPGNLQAENTSQTEGVLETYGMLNVELTGTSGQKLNLGATSVAQIEVPISASISASSPATIPLWSFNETLGYWVEEGFATKIGGKYVGDVSHFSWWNCDAFFPTTDLCVTVLNATTNQPLANVTVNLIFSGTTFPRNGVSNAIGEICGLIPSNEVLTATVLDSCGNTILTTTLGPFSGSGNTVSLAIPNSSFMSTDIIGDFYNCSNNPVTNGYIELFYGSNSSYQYITNGQFSINTIVCNANNSFTIEAVDFDAIQSTGVLNQTFTFPTTNLGSIVSCNTVDEFITIQVDNDPIKIYSGNIDQANNGGSGFSLLALNASNTEEIYITSASNAPGVYNFGTDSISFFESSVGQSMQTMQFNLSSFGPNIGDYIDMTYTGTMLNTSTNATVNVSGTIHVKRDVL